MGDRYHAHVNPIHRTPIMDISEIIDDIMTDTMGEVRGVLFTAMQSGMTLAEVCQLAKHAETPMEFIDAVMMYAGAMPDDMGKWV